VSTTRVIREFETRYELELIDRIDRGRAERVFRYSERVTNADGQTVDRLSHPSYELTGFAEASAQRPQQMSVVATGVDPQQDMHDGPILAVAFGHAGKLWSSGRLAWDNLKIVGIDGTSIEMTGFHAPRNDLRYPFTVDLSTGESETKPYDW
jgi:hypothetical protein